MGSGSGVMWTEWHGSSS